MRGAKDMEVSVEMKGRTDEERSDPVADATTFKARGHGCGEGHHGGKHGSA